MVAAPGWARVNDGGEGPLPSVDSHGAPALIEEAADPGRNAHRAAVMVVVRWRDDALGWGAWRLVRGPGAFKGTPGLRMAKVMGSGHEGGFGLRPGLTHQGLFAFFDDEAQALDFVDHSPVLAAYCAHAQQWLAATMVATSCRGSWSGHTFLPTAKPLPGHPVVALTRGSIRPSRIARFWPYATPAQRELAGAPGCRLAVGMGEAPLVRQCTFSLWDHQAAMDAYARGGAHLKAIRASGELGFFSESMFARLLVRDLRGNWP